MNRRERRIFALKSWTTIFGITSVLTLAVEGVSELELTLEPQDTVVVPGSSATLNCAAASSNQDATPTISWRGGDGQDLSGDPYRSKLSNGSLFFSTVLPGHPGLQGDYQCIATLSSVGSIVSRTAHLKVATLPSLLLQPADQRVFPGQTAYFSCYVEATPPASVLWLKDGRRLHLDETRMLILPSGALEIDEVRASDQGAYVCNVSSLNQHRLSNTALLRIDTNIEAAARIMPPVFIATPQSTVVLEGNTVTLDCAANGNPRPWVSWLKDGINIDMAELGSRFRKVGTGSLQINDVTEEDQGTYQCRASNRDDSVDATATLEVHVPPRFLKKPSDRFALQKEDLELECSVYGKPEPRVQWLRNGDVIPPNDYFQVVNKYNLRILGAMQEDSGIFQCMASNPAGNIQAAARLTIMQPGSSQLGVILTAFTPPPPTAVPAEYEPPPSRESGVPSAPRELRAVIVSTRFVTLSWNQPENANGDIVTYSVFYQQEGSHRERVMNTTASRLTEVNIPGLMPDRTYYFRVVAYNARGRGMSSEKLKVITTPEVHVPGPPQDLQVIPTSPTSFLVKWKPPEQSSGPILHYNIFYMEGDSAEEHHVVTTDNKYELTGLNKFTEYSVWVVAFNQNGAGSSTEEVVSRTLSDVPSEPPQNVTLEASSSTSVTVRWEAPPKEGRNGVITGYKLRYRKRDRRGERRGDTVTTPGDRRLYTLMGLERRSTYQVRLWALTVNGTGPPTNWYSIETYENDLDESQVPDMPTHLKARAMMDTITVSWSPPENQNIMVRGYTIGWGKGIPDAYTQLLDGKQRFYVIENVEPNSEYVISLRAYNDMGDGRPAYQSVRTKEATVPEPTSPLIPPVGLMAIVLSSTTVVVYWTDTTLSKNQFVTDNRYYVVRYTPSHYSNNPRYKYFNATDLNCMIDDLKPNTQYEFTVKVVKGRRESPWSMVVLNMTQEAAPSTHPRDLTVVPVEDKPSAVNLNWQPPKQPNGVITGYVILFTTDQTQKDREWTVKGIVGDKMTIIIDELQPETMYYFKIQARNSRGYGPFSAIVSFTTRPRDGFDFFGRGQPMKDGQGLKGMVLVIIGVACALVFLTGIVVVLVVVCCRRKSANRSKKGYMKGNTKGKPGKPNIKPPDLWIHHDQMELKALEKTQASTGSGGGDIPISVTTLPRTSGGQEFDQSDQHHHSNSLDKRTYVSSYIGGDEKTSTARRIIKPKPITLPVDSIPLREPIATATPIPGSSGMAGVQQDMNRPLYPRTQYTISRAHVTLDQAAQSPENPYSLQGGYDTVASGGGAPGPPHTQQGPYSTGLAATEAGSGTMGKRLQGHPLKSFSVPAPPPQSAPSTPQQKHVAPSVTVRPQGSSPYKKAGILATGGMAATIPAKGRSSLAAPVPSTSSTAPAPSTSTSEDVSKIQPSYSTEELNQEMANLEGLMKDLNAITASEFEC